MDVKEIDADADLSKYKKCFDPTNPEGNYTL